MNTKVAIIGVYFGNWPKYFDLFKHTAFFNESYHWYIFTDQVSVTVKENNITFIPYTLSLYNERLSSVFNTTIEIKERNRICEGRPAFAKIFEEHVQDYDWWGWTDLDLLNGNFNDFLNDGIFDSYDAVNVTVSTIHPGRVAFNGPIMLLSMRLKYLYKEIANYESMLIAGNPQGRHNSFNIEEKDFCDVFFKKHLKLYQGKQVGGHLVPIIRYGKRKLPSRWVNGSVEVQSIREDYPPSYVDAYGCDTMIYHLPKKYNNIVFENGIIEIT